MAHLMAPENNIVLPSIMFSQISQAGSTEMAWDGIIGAVDAARQYKQQVVETEHLMKALLEQKDGLARRIFTKSGIDNSSVLRATEEFISQQPKVFWILTVWFSQLAHLINRKLINLVILADCW